MRDEETMSADELASMDATAQAELVRTGEMSAEELTKAAIQRAERLNPDLNAVNDTIQEIAAGLVDGQLLVLRSTVYPGVTAMVESLTERMGLDVDVAFCPERIAQGRAMIELSELPQIVSSRSPRALERATKLFRNLTHEVVFLEPEEAELAKLFTNTWRYIKFATANQFWMMANDAGVDFTRVRQAITQAIEIPTP